MTHTAGQAPCPGIVRPHKSGFHGFCTFLVLFWDFFGLIVLTSVFTVFLSMGLGGQGGGEDQGGAGGWERGLSKYIECKKINKKFNMCIILESKRAFI